MTLGNASSLIAGLYASPLLLALWDPLRPAALVPTKDTQALLIPHHADSPPDLALPPQSWWALRRRLKDEFGGGWLTPTHYLVLLALAGLVEAGNDCPTNAQIAVEAGASERTVRRAKAAAKERGLLVVTPQFVPVEQGRREQRANRYELLVPEAPVRPKPRIRRGGQSGRPISREVRKKEEERLPTRGPDLLKARAMAFRAMQVAELQAKRGAQLNMSVGR